MGFDAQSEYRGAAAVNPMVSAVYAGCARIDCVSSDNRGLNYGDGVFETMRVDRGGLPLWPRHLARLGEGAQRLGIALPERAFIEARLHEICAGVDTGVIKLLLTRGDGGRGYAPSVDAPPVWVLSLHPLPPKQTALQLHACNTRLATQPLLAGIKHCNRLEQVLARTEAQRAGCDEGLMRDMAGNAVCATAANLLAYCDGRWLTPPIEHCGVAGVLRGWLLEQGMLEVAELSMDALAAADALTLCNAVRGILPVARLGARSWRAQPAVAALQTALAKDYPMYSNTVELA